MLNKDYTANLLNLEDAIITNVENICDEVHVYLGFIEGCNNKTKVLKRVCFGMRNFSNFRKRILFCHT